MKSERHQGNALTGASIKIDSMVFSLFMFNFRHFFR